MDLEGSEKCFAEDLIPRRGPLPRPDFTPVGLLWIVSALEKIGRALSGGHWDGTESSARALPELRGDDGDRARLLKAGRKIGPAGDPVPLVGGKRLTPVFVKPMTAGSYRQEQEAAARYVSTVAYFRQLCYGSYLTTYIIGRDGHIQSEAPTLWADRAFFDFAITFGRHNRVGAGPLFFCADAIMGLTAKITLASAAKAMTPGAHEETGGDRTPLSKIVDWLKQRHPNGIPAPEEEDWEAAKAHFGPGLPRSRLREARDNTGLKLKPGEKKGQRKTAE